MGKRKEKEKKPETEEGSLESPRTQSLWVLAVIFIAPRVHCVSPNENLANFLLSQRPCFDDGAVEIT
ncbi:unnamed protein product [Caenorhabditis auriculariae]|uniref:Uncharacterized protein n=1 Tax=Caenorhabditis auriculariae TaxID=2777116 RepID=A0A8S1GW55_9PELO|nr:unnamed protein product [Caenorhabditis auriculariae]